MHPIDVTITACRRPALIARTLESFSKHFFSVVPPGTAYVNIDPLWGDELAGAGVEALCKEYFEHVVVRQPNTPSFGAAVKWLWAQPRTEWFLHLEDDWVMKRPISEKRIQELIGRPSLGQIRLVAGEHPLRRPFKARRVAFTTSPSLVRRPYAIIASNHMNPDLDPEKQYSRKINKAGINELSRYELLFYSSRWTFPLLIDIGRDWRERRAIRKELTADGKSVWTS